MAYRFGIDAGSKTVKVVVLDEDGTPLHSVYQRHLSNIRETLTDILHNLAWRYGDLHGRAAVTGSAGIALADMLGLPFVQEVVSTTRAVKEAYPEADAVVELGGEDAKVMYLSGNPEQRMNATCAGGTGGFIDTIAFMLGVRSSEMSRLAGGANRIYPIASRCAVFAQTDVRPLLNSGAKKSDIAASALEAVVRQTITGLACGRPISGTVVFLGGPFEHIPELTRRFRMALGLKRGCGIKPRDAHLFTARGAAICAGEAEGNAETSLRELEAHIRSAKSPEDDLVRLDPLFSSGEEREAFEARHKAVDFPRRRLFDSEGPLYVGIDAGSTTVKMAVLDDEKNLVHSSYRPVRGDALATATEMLLEFRQAMPHAYASGHTPTWVAHSTATGYGEELLRAALGVDSGIVETTAHARAALELVPDATFVFDIGGQDMKALWIRNGMISNAILNEACSSGCGSFIEGTAHSLKTTPYAFCDAALTAENPVDLGTKCTVFMTSRIRHAQKIGAGMPDLAAGIAYSVVKNALYRIIGAERVGTLGDKIVVQGGAFKSDAVLRAFEKICGVEAIRPDSAHLMGAIGSALVARERAHARAKREGSPRGVASALLSADDLLALDVKRFSARCPGCANGCSLSVADFGGGRRLVSGNRCPKAEGFDYAPSQAPVPRAAETVVADSARADRASASSSQGAPNAITVEQRILGRFGDQVLTGKRGACRIGIMNCFESYEYLPFWHTLFTRLGFSVLVPDDARGEKYEREALATVPAEGVCFPAKMAHTRLFDLLEAGACAVFMPHFERAGRCAVSCEYALALADAVPAFSNGKAALCTPRLRSFKASRVASSPDDVEALRQALGKLCPPEAPLERGELDAAVQEALHVQEQVFSQIERANERVISWLGKSEGNHAIVVAGRPYHSDPRLMRGVDRILERLGFGILSPTSLDKWAKRSPHDPVCPPWKPGKHLARLARFAAANDHVDLVCLQSFGCGYDALSLEDARDTLEAAGKPFTALKIDDLSDKAHIRIRLRTLAESIELTGKREAAENGARTEQEPGCPPSPLTPQASEHGDGPESAKTDSGSPVAPDVWVMKTPVTESDVETARREIPGDVCFTAAALMAKALRAVRENPQVERLHVPYVCNQCLLDGLGHTLWRLSGTHPEIVWEESFGKEAGAQDRHDGRRSEEDASATPAEGSDDAVRVGIVGNPLLCFDAFMNGGIVELLRSLGCEVAMPESARLFVENVRYLDQLDAFAREGVDCVIYLQSFGCMKAHVHARGFLRELERRWPDMPVTVVDYDPESSALNRENRIRLAIEAARRKKRGL